MSGRNVGLALIGGLTLASSPVAGSILAHGVTATPLALWYGRTGDDAEWW